LHLNRHSDRIAADPLGENSREPGPGARRLSTKQPSDSPDLDGFADRASLP
jgi:hypothetical protein